ncbi:lantibiotic dehydratase [Chitinophaga sp. RAB17]|uniref:lantibiotic dehydratase n=1 Tax=Chitinophaga sp. RAB17 TaxID=3233049 RepID=UPI003F8F5347
MNVHLFPYPLVRYAGIHTSLLEQWQLPDAHLYHLHTASQQQQREALCDKLYEQVMLQTDDHLRRKIISLKRMVYNDKLPDNDLLDLLLPLFEKEVAADINNYISTKKIHAQQLLEQHNRYDAFLLQQRRHLHQLLAQSDVEKGIILSSPVLFRQLPPFREKDPLHYKNAENKIEFSLLRYLTRSCYKTSPFSTFTHTRLGTFIATETNPPGPTAGRVKLNNSIFRYLTGILCRHPGLNELLIVSKNMTLQEEDKKLHFLVNYLNVEAFQSIPASAVNILILELLEHGPLSFHRLINTLTEAASPIPRAEIKDYLLKMIATGALEMGTGISGMEENWASQLIAFFGPHSTAHDPAKRICEALASLEKYKKNFTVASAAERANILAAAENTINPVFSDLQQEAGLPVEVDPAAAEDDTNSGLRTMQFAPHFFKGNELFYEDCYNPETEVICKDTVQQITENVDALLELIQPLDQLYEEKQRMLHHFYSYYGVNGSVPVVRFYQSYYQQLRQENVVNNPEPEATAWKNNFVQSLDNLLYGQPAVINLWDEHFPAIATVPTPQSRGMFMQFYSSENITCGVVNAILPGMGKVNGRFLSMFDNKATTAFLDYNRSLHPDKKVMELNDASGFNANIHPPLAAYEIKMPGGNNNYPSGQQISLNELYITAEDKQLSLYHGGQQVYAYDLSLESFRNRSRLYQLLAHFNPDIRPSITALIKIIDGEYEKKHPRHNAPVYVWPRVTYRTQVVLRRKTWEIDTRDFPVIRNNEKELEYFIRLQHWREQHQIDAAVFLFLRRRGNSKTKEKAGGLADDYKPQFISFQQPILLTMLKKLLSRAGSHIWLEEALPMPTGQVKEYLLQWYKH